MSQNTPVSYVGKHTFTSEEKEQKLQQMLSAMREKEEIEAEFKTTKSNYKSKIDAKEGEIKLTSNLLNAGWENKTYNCNLVKNFEDGKRQYIEIGTNLLVGEEPLTAADYQVQMNLEEKAIRENNEKADNEAGLLHSGDDPFDLTPEEIEAAEQHPELIEEIDEPTNEWQPSEFPIAEEKEVKPTEKGGEKEKTEPTTEPEPTNMFGSDDEEEDPFSFNDI